MDRPFDRQVIAEEIALAEIAAHEQRIGVCRKQEEQEEHTRQNAAARVSHE
jgi:hypothetical protein